MAEERIDDGDLLAGLLRVLATAVEATAQQGKSMLPQVGTQLLELDLPLPPDTAVHAFLHRALTALEDGDAWNAAAWLRELARNCSAAPDSGDTRDDFMRIDDPTGGGTVVLMSDDPAAAEELREAMAQGGMGNSLLVVLPGMEGLFGLPDEGNFYLVTEPRPGDPDITGQDPEFSGINLGRPSDSGVNLAGIRSLDEDGGSMDEPPVAAAAAPPGTRPAPGEPGGPGGPLVLSADPALASRLTSGPGGPVLSAAAARDAVARRATPPADPIAEALRHGDDEARGMASDV